MAGTKKIRKQNAFATALSPPRVDLVLDEDYGKESLDNSETLSALHTAIYSDEYPCGPVCPQLEHFQLLSDFNSWICACKQCGRRVLGTLHLHPKSTTMKSIL